jgi:hypothetical protein
MPEISHAIKNVPFCMNPQDAGAAKQLPAGSGVQSANLARGVFSLSPVLTTPHFHAGTAM